MDIEKEKSVFLGIYKYYPSAIKFTFDVENECFVLSKKNPLDHEVEVMSQMNQQWVAWLRRAKLEYEKLNGCVVVPKSEITDWYLDEDEYIYTDEPDIFLCDLEPGDVLEVKRQQCWQAECRFAAKVYEDEDNINWELFDSKEEAEKAAAHCKAMVEAARGGNENS